jgi:hypothetical protein
MFSGQDQPNLLDVAEDAGETQGRPGRLPLTDYRLPPLSRCSVQCASALVRARQTGDLADDAPDVQSD